MTTATPVTPGPVLFARFAYPPNALGYCGPDDHPALLQYVAAGVCDRGLVSLAREFTGAWPYLQLIAAAARIPEPLDVRVVQAYWVGNSLLERVGSRLLAAHLEERFRRPAGRHWTDLAELAVAGARPHHNFHVFGVYPWVGMLRAGRAEHPLRVLDSCRVRWGRVTAWRDGLATVRSRPLDWDGSTLALGPERTKEAVFDQGGLALSRDVRPGCWVALHWHWVCDVLDERGVRALRHYTVSQLAVVNHALNRPARAAAFE